MVMGTSSTPVSEPKSEGGAKLPVVSTEGNDGSAFQLQPSAMSFGSFRTSFGLLRVITGLNERRLRNGGEWTLELEATKDVVIRARDLAGAVGSEIRVDDVRASL